MRHTPSSQPLTRREALCRAGGGPQASHRWRPGGFERFPGLLCLGVGQQLRAKRRNASQSRQSRAITDAGASAADR